MLATIICVGIAIACLTQGAVEGAIAMGILAVVVYFLFGSQAPSKEKSGTNPSPSQGNAHPTSDSRATPALIAHYSSSPVVAQIVREIRQKGAEENISISKNGSQLLATGGEPYLFVFPDHGYQPLTPEEQASILVAIVEQLPHADTYRIGYDHYEGTTNPIRYFATTSFYRDNQYRWNRDTHTWEKLTRL